ncbi:MAG TPA: DUF4363 family protein [Candidatus Scatosoma pullicola]|nr:DUF4363 family protein [Candidatus Scatosoma pullicola]
MVKTVAGIFLSLAFIVGISAYEMYSVGSTFRTFSEALCSLYEKTEEKTAAYEDGVALRTFWKDKKRTLHIWIPHTSIENVDYQLNEALGYLSEQKYDDALPKIEVLIEMSEKIPRSYAFSFENIF